MSENEHEKSYFEHLEEVDVETKDLIVIGGGINGAGIAAMPPGAGCPYCYWKRKTWPALRLPPVPN